MLYLEDYLEMIEHLPQHFRETLTQMREWDLQVNNDIDSWQVRVNKFFNDLSTNNPSPEIRNSNFNQIKQDYQKAVDVAEEKMAAANQLYEIVDKYLRKLEQELLKFKMELEADNAGITEILEKRSLELDNPPTSSSNHKGEKRKLGTFNSNDQKLNSTSSDKMLHGFTQESNATVNYGSSKNHNNMPQSSTPGTENPFESIFNSKFASEKNTLASKLKVNIPGSSSGNPIAAAAASQAIAATQNTQIGRRTSSLKASYEAINSGFPHFNFPPIRMDDNDSSVGYLRQSNDLEQAMANKKSRLNNKKNRTINQYDLDLNNEPSSDVANEHWASDDTKYCVCNNVSYGEMIYCENFECPFGQWFHYECVGIFKPPKGSWFCAACLKKLNKDINKNKKKISSQ